MEDFVLKDYSRGKYENNKINSAETKIILHKLICKNSHNFFEIFNL